MRLEDPIQVVLISDIADEPVKVENALDRWFLKLSLYILIFIVEFLYLWTGLIGYLNGMGLMLNPKLNNNNNKKKKHKTK